MRQDFPSASSFELHGFGDVQYYQFLNSDDADENGAFFLGQLDLYVAESIGPRLDVLTEVAIESPDGAEFVIDLERIQIGYLFSDALKVSAGRFHTPLGYWNTAYHHGAFLHTTIERPLFVRFEDDGGRYGGTGNWGSWPAQSGLVNNNVKMSAMPSLFVIVLSR